LPRRVVEVVAVSALSAIVTLAIAAPILRAPSERVFGMAIVGRHHDPFTVMEQFGRPITLGMYSQPITDVTGALLARMSGAVAAYNWLVLLSFPLSAAAAYLLARHLALSPAGATLAAMAYAFSPFHLAHAAYHPHIAQVQWVPLYLLALWRCLDDASPSAVAFLGAATITVTLSNFYGGLIAAVITPVAVAAYWLFPVRLKPDTTTTTNAPPAATTIMTRVSTTIPQSMRRRNLIITIGSLVLIAVAGLAYASYAARAVVLDRAAFAFPRDDLFRYSAKWWSYLVPPVEHPVLGATVRRIWTATGVREGLVEQQVSLGWGIVALGLIASAGWLRRDREPPSLTRVPVLVIVAVAALVCSLSPERTIGALTFVRPSAFLYRVVPMFRSYARFGVVVQLMAALLAGIGVDSLRRAGTRRAQIVCVALVVLAAGEYAASPSALWRDVLPTTAHRWVMRQPGRVRVLDCTPLDPESESIQWLTGDRVTLLGGSIGGCSDANLSRKLATNGYTHLLVRRDTADGRSLGGPAPDGLRVAARFDDGEVFTVTGQTPAIYTATMTGFFPRESDAEWTWRWMGADAAWTIVNAGARPSVAVLALELSAFHRSRGMELRLDGRPVQTLVVNPWRHTYQIGPLTVMPGEHELVFHPAEGSTVAGDAIGNGDRRPLSFAFGTWTWTVRGEQQ
jgi:hypothetical protein